MLRELSLLTKRHKARTAPNASALTRPTASPGAKVPRGDAQEVGSEPDEASANLQKQHSRGLAGLPRRLSRGPTSFHRGNSFLSRNRPKAAESQTPTPGASESSSKLRLHGRPNRTAEAARRRTARAEPAAAPAGPRAFARKPGLAVPLQSVDELFKWRPTGFAAKCVSTVPLSDAAIKRYIRGGLDRLPTSSAPASTVARGNAGSLKRLQPPRLLLCHDFKGGYPEWEANASGVFGDDCPSDSELWRFNHWAYVDVFVYFSHYRVTIPPVGYIHAAHRHGSLALGTIIFEWGAGTSDLVKILASFKTRAKAANQLASIAKFHGFDGWLLNVEVALQAGSSAASDLVAFVGDLTRATRKILGPVSEVIWYDSVTRDGSLAWQNELNDENEQFFKAAGSLFTNYHWDRNAPVRSAVKAGTRRTDVFTGIDIHGRNTFGGGGFHTHIALRAIKQGGTSAAIFAPAWTVEKCPPNVSDPRQLEERFWAGPSGRFGRESVAQYFRERPVLTDLPFTTCFDPGWGPRLMRNGNVKDDRRYFNIAQQQVQPSFMRAVVAAGEPGTVDLSSSHERAYNGSTSIKVAFLFSESRMLTGSFSVMRLLVASVPFPARLSSRITKSQDGCLKVSYNYYAQCEGGAKLAANDFGIVLLFGSPPSVVLLVGQNSRWNMSSSNRRAMPRLQLHGKYVDMEVCVADTDRRAFGSPIEKDGDGSGWMTRTFVLDSALTSAQRLIEVMIIVGGPPEQPISVRPSPLMSPNASVRGSRPTSRMASRVASRDVSRANSPTRNGDGERRTGGDLHSSARDRVANREEEGAAGEESAETEENGDLFGTQLLSRYRDSVVQRRKLNYSQPGSRKNSDHEADSTPKAFERRQESSPMTFRRSGVAEGGIVGRVGTNELDVADMKSGDGVRDRGLRGLSGYGGGDLLGEGSLNFERMEMEEDISTNASLAMSRFSSRLATPMGGSRYASRLNSLSGSRASSVSASLAQSLSASRQGSVSNSLAGSRQGSRFTSPTGTPMGGGGGARPSPGDSAAKRSGLMSPGFASRRESGMESGMATPSRNSAAISELKSALMHAAGSMAGGASATEGGKVAGTAKIVYLGGIRLEIVETKEDGRALGGGFSRS